MPLVDAAVRKAELRAALPPSLPADPGCGRLAEQVRRAAWYRAARVVFATPSPLLRQVRINVLADGKALLMPSASLRCGFLLFPPRSVPFARLAHAVTPKGARRFARHLGEEELCRWPVDLALTDALRVDRAGVRLGTGDGFFDLAVALLAAWKGLAPSALAVACLWSAAALSSSPLPSEPFDVPVQVAVCATGELLLPLAPSSLPAPAILWQCLERRQVRRIDPLWKLWQRLQPGRGRRPVAG